MLKLKISLALCALCYLAMGQNQASNTLLWEVSGKNLKKPSYLFGTYHFIGKSFIDSMGTLKTKLSETQGVVGELVMDDQELAKLAPQMVSDTTLDQLLTPKAYEEVNGIVKAKLKTDLRYFNTMKPMAIQVLMLAAFSPVKMPAKNDGLDIYFQQYARQNQHSVQGLETVQEQAKLLFGTSLKKQADYLLKMARDTTKIKQQGKELFEAYIAQNQQALLNLFKDSDESPDNLKQLLEDRNQKWLAKLPAMMTEKPLFIAVGAGHLFGKVGLIEGLRRLGYQVKPIQTH